MREYVAAFANGDGGILCIGPADKNDPTTGRRPCYPLDAPSTIPVDDWLKEHLGELLPFLSPLPRIIQQRYHAGSEEVDVVFIAVARAPGLVPLYDKAKRPTWWVRFRDSNRQIPEYLAADIILGRRNAPTLALRDPRLFAGRLIHNSAQERSGELKISVTVDNLGFVAAENVIVGLIAWFFGTRDAAVPNESLQRYVEFHDPGAAFSAWRDELTRRHLTYPCDEIHAWNQYVATFQQRGTYSPSLCVPVQTDGTTEFAAGLYLHAKGFPPQWYQLRSFLREGSSPVTLERLHFERPEIAIRSS